MSAGSGAVVAPESTELLTGSHFHYFVIVIMVDKLLVRRKVRSQSPWPLRHYCCSCCGYIVCLCNFVLLSVMFFFCLFFLNLISNHSDFRQPGFNNINFMDSSFFFSPPPHFSMEDEGEEGVNSCLTTLLDSPGSNDTQIGSANV